MTLVAIIIIIIHEICGRLSVSCRVRNVLHCKVLFTALMLVTVKPIFYSSDSSPWALVWSCNLLAFVYTLFSAATSIFVTDSTSALRTLHRI